MLRTESKETETSLRAEFREEMGGLKNRMTRLEDRIIQLDDRIYTLAVGLRPILEERHQLES